jgi:hypothetical protein
MRDRLIELLNKTFAEQYDNRGLLTAPHTADHLLANGVVVPPCGVGWTIYLLKDDCVYCGQVKSIDVYIKTMRINGMYWNEDEKEWYGFTSPLCCFGKDIFLTKEEAEQALKERE